MSHPAFSATAAALLLGTSLSALAAAPAAAAQLHSAPLPRGAQFAQSQIETSASVSAYRHAMDKIRKARHAKKSPHFSYPFGIGADGIGNVYVSNAEGKSVSVINGNLKATSAVITQNLTTPVSVAADGLGNVFVGNLNGSTGDVIKYYNGTLQNTIATNTSAPYSIALDAFDDLYVVSGAGIATDDPSGNQIFAPEYGNYGVISVAVGNASVYGFYNDNFLVGNGSIFLRTGGLQEIVGPSGATNPLGVACAQNACWYSDSVNGTLVLANGSGATAISLGYTPVGVAFDPIHDRVFVADPINNAVHVYNPSTLALEKTVI